MLCSPDEDDEAYDVTKDPCPEEREGRRGTQRLDEGGEWKVYGRAAPRGKKKKNPLLGFGGSRGVNTTTFVRPCLFCSCSALDARVVCM